MKIYSVNSEEFIPYGRIVRNIDFSDLLEVLRTTPVPEDVSYEPTVPALEKTSAKEKLSVVAYGEMPIQIGYCNGHNSRLNALEYHRDSEINIAAEDIILILGLESEIEADFTYDTSKVKAFLVPAETAVEIYATTLHYAPCGVNGKGFQVAVVLPLGTNYPLRAEHVRAEDAKALPNEDRLLAAVNKWLIGHPEGGLDEGAFIGLKGENPDVMH